MSLKVFSESDFVISDKYTKTVDFERGVVNLYEAEEYNVLVFKRGKETYFGYLLPTAEENESVLLWIRRAEEKIKRKILPSILGKVYLSRKRVVSSLTKKVEFEEKDSHRKKFPYLIVEKGIPLEFLAYSVIFTSKDRDLLLHEKFILTNAAFACGYMLGLLHANGLHHNDLAPHNLVFNGDFNDVRLIDVFDAVFKIDTSRLPEWYKNGLDRATWLLMRICLQVKHKHTKAILRLFQKKFKAGYQRAIREFKQK